MALTRHVNIGLAVICAFVGGKLLLQALHSSGVGWAKVLPPWLQIRTSASSPLGIFESASFTSAADFTGLRLTD